MTYKQDGEWQVVQQNVEVYTPTNRRRRSNLEVMGDRIQEIMRLRNIKEKDC